MGTRQNQGHGLVGCPKRPMMLQFFKHQHTMLPELEKVTRATCQDSVPCTFVPLYAVEIFKSHAAQPCWLRKPAIYLATKVPGFISNGSLFGMEGSDDVAIVSCFVLLPCPAQAFISPW